METINGSPTLALAMQLKIQIPVAELLKCLTDWHGEVQKLPDRVDRVDRVDRPVPVPEERTERTERIERTVRKTYSWTHSLYEMQPTYAAYAAKENVKWRSCEYEGAHVLPEAAQEEFMKNDFEPLPLPTRTDVTHKNYQEADLLSSRRVVVNASPLSDGPSLGAEQDVQSVPYSAEQGAGNGFSASPRRSTYPSKDCKQQ